MEATEDVYYTENNEIMDADGCWGMQEAVIVENENLNWQEDGSEITVSYADSADAVNQTLSESDVYLSTNVEDSLDNDKSQYYSILESTYQGEQDGYETNLSANIIVKVDNQDESILPDLPESNHYLDHNDDIKDCPNEESLNSQVILYHSDDPNEMYAIQIADDGSGHLQKFKYKVRQTADGQLEAIPGTIEVQDANTDDSDIEKSGISDDMVNSENMITQEEMDEEMANSVNQVHVNEVDENKIKHDISPKKEIISQDDDTKMSEDNFDASESYVDEEYGTPEYLLSDDNNYDEDIGNNYEVMSQNEDDLALKLQKNFTLEEFNTEIDYNAEDEIILKEKDESLESDALKFLNQSHVIKRKFFKSKITNSPFHDYEEENEHMSTGKDITIFKDEKSVSYLVVDTKEKENVSVTQIKTTFGLKNARSILKSNYILPTEDQKKNVNIKKITSIRMLNNNKGIVTKEKDVIKSSEDKFEKNKITQAKIAAKSVRQPRKQTIKPIERLGSEIIVQPMYYTYNNEYSDFIVRKKRKYTHRSLQEVVKVSDDSDPDYTEKPKPKKKKTNNSRRISKHKKIPQITIIDSDITTDDESVIEVFSDQETDDIIETLDNEDISNNENTKEDNTEDNDLDKCDDILKIQEAVDNIVQERERAEKEKAYTEIMVPAEKPNRNNVFNKSGDKTTKKNNIKCPICPKTFPRQINLKTHMNIHNARRVLRSKTNSVLKIDSKNDVKSVSVKTPIINSNAPKKDTLSCTKCKLKFLTQSQFARHKMIHTENKSIHQRGISLRKHFLKTSNISPKLRAGLNKMKNNVAKITKTSVIKTTSMDMKKVVTPSKEPFKCKYCNKSFSQRALLNIHQAAHKPFSCSNCSIKFSTKIHLDEHLRKSCVKKTVLKQNAVRRSSMNNKSVESKTLLKCETCNLFFSTLTKLHQHESVSHKKQITNNKSNAVKKNFTRPKKAHGGVPASAKMQKAFDLMKLRS